MPTPDPTPTTAPDRVHLAVSTALHDLWGYRQTVDPEEFTAAVERFTSQRWVRLAVDTAWAAGRDSAHTEQADRNLRYLHMSEQAHRAEQDRDMWRTRYEATTVPDGVEALVADNDRLRAEVKQARDATSAALAGGAQMWRDMSESLAEGARWWWRWGVEPDGLLVVADDPDEPVLWMKSEAEARQFVSDTGGKLVRQRRVAYPPEPAPTGEAATDA